MAPPTVVGTPQAARYTNPSVVVPSGADYLIGGGGYAPGDVDPGPAATRDGQGLTFLGQSPAGATYSAQAMFGLVSPNINTTTLTVTGTGVAGRQAMSLTGIDTGTPVGTRAIANGDSTSPAVTCDTGADALAVALIRFTGGGSITISGGTGETVQVQYFEDSQGHAIITKARTGATTSFAPTLSASTTWEIIAAGFNGTSAAGGGRLVGGALLGSVLVGGSLAR